MSYRDSPAALHRDATTALGLLRSERDHSPGNRLLSAALTRLAVGAGTSVSTRPLGSALARLAPELHPLLGRSEAALERHWARRVIRSGEPERTLRQFPYFAGYVDLCTAEAGRLRGRVGRPDAVVVVGSGPLPVSGLLLGRLLGCRIVLVERDPGAAALGAGVMRAVNAGDRTLMSDGRRLRSGIGDVVLVAALVDGREAILQHALSVGARVVAVRSAVGNRQLLYPALNEDVPLARLVDSSGVIRGVLNTTLLFEPIA